jgi:hypothetical protein
MKFYLDSSIHRAGGLLCGIVILATLLSYATANKRRPPETLIKRSSSVALAVGSVETADRIDLTDDFTERWTAVAAEAYRAAVAGRSRPIADASAKAAPAPAPAATAPAAAAPVVVAPAAAASPSESAPQYPMAQATEDDIKQYLDDHRAKAEKNSEQRSRDGICRKGKIYFYREHHQYWHCRR